MGSPGCASYLFDRKGVFIIPKSAVAEDTLMNVILEAGADDMQPVGDNYEVLTDVTAFNGVQAALEKAGIKPETAEISQVPKAAVDVDLETGKKIVKLIGMLDEHDDVQTVYTNAKLSAEMANEDD